MPRHVAHVLAVMMLSSAFSSSVQAQQRGFSINHLDLSERGSEWFSSDSLDLRGHLRPAIGIVGEWAFRPLVVYDQNDKYVQAIVRNQFVLHPGVSVVLWDRVRFALDVPVQAYADGKSATIGTTDFAAPSDKTSLGDIRLGATLRLFGVYGDPITGAFGVQVALPTGSRDAYAGDGDARVTPSFAIAGDVAWFVYAAKAAVTIRSADHGFSDSHVGSYASFSASAGVRVVDKRLVVGPEFFARSLLLHDQFFKKDATPMEGLIGLHYMVVDGLRIGAGFGIGLTEAFGSPQRRGLLSLEWVPGIEKPLPPPPSDRDGDHIVDEEDACPDVPGPMTSDASTNGCPPPADRDHDGVLDADDACPDVSGDKTDDPKTNGCPPPPDRDHDGVLDADDACPDVSGDKTDDPKTNGCPPPPDRDHDGVLDADDACPDDPGNPSPDPKRNGCPRAYVQGGQIRILDQVKFKTGSAMILPGQESEDVLLAVLQVLQQHPQVSSVRVEGHTDNRGSAKMNRNLSKNRAQSVLTWLVKHGIEASRLSAQGFGP
ncbi:MAG TPA: OmpA family protein, partial [Polyangiales bacterium]|nr:OmpA family protein [Polyangiales bacterium]